MNYLDNNATTRVAPAVLEAMLPFLTECYGNPSSTHSHGMAAKAAVASARAQVASLIGVQLSEIVFTSGCTESNHMAISGVMTGGRRRIVTSAGEHASTLALLESLDAEVVRVPLLASGGLDLQTLEAAVTPDTALVSVMWANNETGALFPVETVARIAHARGALFHTDAAQVIGRSAVAMVAAGVDLASFSGHKMYAPKGVGALYVRKGVMLRPFLHGEQERRRRGGTENVVGIVALGAASLLALNSQRADAARLGQLRNRFESELLQRVPDICINAAAVRRLPNTSSITFSGIDAEELLARLDRAGIAASSGSACSAGGDEPSHVLTAMGLSPRAARSTLRFSLGRFNTDADIDYVIDTLPALAAQLRQPLAA